MLSGEMDPRSPAWLTQGYQTLKDLGYTSSTDSDNAGDQYAQKTGEVGLEYLRLFLTEPDNALASIGGYLHSFGEINREVGVLSRTTPEQFGMIVNIASLHYTTFDRERLRMLHRGIGSYLKGRNSASIPGLTAEIRKPELLRDLVAHWSAVNWPSTGSYPDFLAENTDWKSVQKHVELPENNPVLFALTVPLDTTDPGIRYHFRENYPGLTQQGIDIIAARLFNRGGHDEILRSDGSTPELAAWYQDHYNGWEESMDDRLARYGIEYRPAISRAITKGKWNLFPEEDLSFPQLMEKLTTTSFSLNKEGKLVRNSTA